MTAPDPGRADRLLRLITEHPEALAAAQSDYGGRHDLRDALWWRVHRGTPAPSGVADPALDRDRLAATAYGRGGSAEDLARVEEAESALARDRAELDALLDRRDHPHANLEDAAVAAASAGDTGLDDSTVDDSSDGDSPPHGTSAPSRHRWRTAIASAVILILAVAIVGLGMRLASTEASLSGAPPATGPDPLARFDAAQAEGDAPEVSLPYDYVPSSLRRLLRPEQTGLTDDYVLYGARTAQEDVCLILVFPDENTASSCVSLREFRQNGVRVSANVLRSSRASVGSRIPVAHTVTWRSDGAFHFSSALADRAP